MQRLHSAGGDSAFSYEELEKDDNSPTHPFGGGFLESRLDVTASIFNRGTPGGGEAVGRKGGVLPLEFDIVFKGLDSMEVIIGQMMDSSLVQCRCSPGGQNEDLVRQLRDWRDRTREGLDKAFGGKCLTQLDTS